MSITLTTQRLSLREVTLEDLEQIHALHSLPETDAYNTLGIPGNINETAQLLDEWMERQRKEPRASYVFCILLPGTDTFTGLLGLNLGEAKYRTGEVWYKLRVDHWNKGYATEALKGVLHFAFHTLGLHRVEAGCAVDNAGSINVLEKAGMVREGRKRKKLPIRGEWKDNYFYAILEEDFINKG